LLYLNNQAFLNGVHHNKSGDYRFEGAYCKA